MPWPRNKRTAQTFWEKKKRQARMIHLSIQASHQLRIRLWLMGDHGKNLDEDMYQVDFFAQPSAAELSHPS